MTRMRSAGQLIALILGSNLLISGINRLLSGISLDLQWVDLHYFLHVQAHLHNAYMLVGLMLSFVTGALERRYNLKPTDWGWTEFSGWTGQLGRAVDVTPATLLTTPLHRVAALLFCLPVPGLIIVPALWPFLWVTVLLGLLVGGVLFFQARQVSRRSASQPLL